MKTALFGLCVLAIGIAVFISGVNSLRMAYRAKSWPTAAGVIRSCKCVRYSDMDGINVSWTYFTHANYSYTVEGRSYPGDRIAFGYSGSWWQRPNQKIADRLSAAKRVMVRYDPGKPSMAVLSYGLNGSTVRALFIGSWLMFAAVVVLLYAFRSKDTGGLLVLSWGSNGAGIMVQGVGGIAVLVVIGWAIASLLGLVIDLGILGTIEIR